MSMDRQFLIKKVAEIAPQMFKKEMVPYLKGEAAEANKIKSKLEKSQKASGKKAAKLKNKAKSKKKK
jgi:hypothetical protein